MTNPDSFKPRRKFSWPLALTLVALIVAALVALIFLRLESWPARTAKQSTAELERVGREVRDAMDAIGSGTGDLTQRLPSAGSDEVAQIARAFNSFVDKLNQVMWQIRDASESVRTPSSMKLSSSPLPARARSNRPLAKAIASGSIVTLAL